MRRRHGITLVEVLIGVAFLLVAGFFLLSALRGHRKEVEGYRIESSMIRCRNSLNMLAKGMATYLNECGDNRFYPWPAGRAGCGTVANPQFGGAEWLASLYWTRIIPDPGVFNCPCSPDSNGNGADLGDDGCPGGRPLSAGAVSYAAMGDVSEGIYMASKAGKGPSYARSKLAIRDDFPPSVPMACDDTEEPINHGEKDNGGMCILFFDSHVEFWTHTKIDLERGVGTGSLAHLRN